MKAIAKISRQLESIDHRRKVILCLGLPSVCDVNEPALGGTSVIWPAWVAAISAAARANVSVYCVDPTGARGGLNLSSNGLVQITGGAIFAHQNDFLTAARAIWREAGHYYLLGYWPAVSKRDLHDDRRHRHAQRRPRPRAPATVNDRKEPRRPRSSQRNVSLCGLSGLGGFFRIVIYVFGFQAKYTGTPSSTITRPGQVVAGRYTNSTSRIAAAPAM